VCEFGQQPDHGSGRRPARRVS